MKKIQKGNEFDTIGGLFFGNESGGESECN